jgi:dihydroneopterin aldolase
MKATIKIRKLSYDLRIGVTEEEQKHSQLILVDFDIEVDITKAIKTECIDDTINYSTMQKTIEKYLESKQYKLLEKCTDDIATMLFETFVTINKISCTCLKPQALQTAKNVGVTIVKSRE